MGASAEILSASLGMTLFTSAEVSKREARKQVANNSSTSFGGGEVLPIRDITASLRLGSVPTIKLQ